MATPFMNLTGPVPGPGGTPGPQWAQEVNADLSIIDAHDHTPGNGVPLSIAAIDINQDVNFNEFNATNMGTLFFFNQPAALIGLNGIYAVQGDLFFNDGFGNQIQITAGGGLNASSIGGIGGDYVGSTASAFYTSILDTFGFTSAPGVPAKIQAGDLLITSLNNTNVVTLSNPNSGSSYTLNLPDSLPVSGTSFMTVDSTGNIGDLWQLDNVTIQQSANVIAVRNGERSHHFAANGIYRVGTNIDGMFVCPYNLTITNVVIYHLIAGSGGSTTYRLRVRTTLGGVITPIFSTDGVIASTAGSYVWMDSGSVIPVTAGITKPVLSAVNFNAGDSISFQIVTTQTGAYESCGCIIYYKQR
jgi:hypothetical protein